jgi:hypothetical protein
MFPVRRLITPGPSHLTLIGAASTVAGGIARPPRLAPLLSAFLILLGTATLSEYAFGLETQGEAAARIANAAEESPAQQVTDNGIGLTAETVRQRFTSFSQAETSTMRRFDGTGLGPATSHRLVGLMDAG